MKKVSFVAKLLCAMLCMALVFTGCTGGTSSTAASESTAASTEAASTESTDSTSTAAATGEPIKIGLLEPITGPIAATGMAIRDAAQIYEAYINDNGGINGRPVQLIVEDTANDPTMSSSAINKLINQDKVLAVIGAWGSSPTLAAIPIARENKIPMVVETASNYKVTDKDEEGGDYVYRLSAPSLMEMTVLKAVLKDDLKFEKPYLISVNNDWGHGNTEEFTHLYEEVYGLPVAGADFVDATETDYSAVLTKVLASGADSIILTGDAAQISMIVEQASNLGVDLPKLGLGMACCIYKIEQLAGEAAANNFYQTVSYVGSIDANKTANPEMATLFLDSWNAKGYEMMEIQEGARGFDAMYVMCEALKSIDGDITSESINTALQNLECDTMSYGHVKFTDWGNFVNQNITPVAVIGIKDGEEVVQLDLTYPVFSE